MRFLFVFCIFGIRFTGYYLWQNFMQVRHYIGFLKQEQDIGHSAWWIFLQTKGVAGLFDCHCHLPFLVTIKGFPGRRICLIFTTVILGLVAGHLDFVIKISLKDSLNTNVCTLHSAQSHPMPLWILRFECALKTATKMMNCIPWYLPQKNATKPCRFKTDEPKPITEGYTCHSSTKTAKFTEEMALVDGASCDCLPDCKTTDYQYSMTSSKLRS